MNIYEESNWENLSMVRDLVDEDFNMVDKKYLYEMVRKSYCAYIKNDFLQSEKNCLAFLIDKDDYLAGLRISNEGEFFLIEALETKPKYRRLGYGEKLMREVINSLVEGKEIRSEVTISNTKSLALHHKIGFKTKIKKEKNLVL